MGKFVKTSLSVISVKRERENEREEKKGDIIRPFKVNRSL